MTQIKSIEEIVLSHIMTEIDNPNTVIIDYTLLTTAYVNIMTFYQRQKRLIPRQYEEICNNMIPEYMRKSK